MKLAVFALLALASAACQPLDNRPGEVPVRELRAGILCLQPDAALKVIGSPTEALALPGLRPQLGTKSQPIEADTSHEHLLLVAAGNKPSAGYRLQLEKSSAGIENGDLQLPVTLTEPGLEFRAAVITSPCLLLAVGRGDYRRIVVDSMGLRLELTAD